MKRNESYVGLGEVAGSEEAATLHQCLWAMECAYWDDVDFNAGQLAHEFYCDDAVFDIGLPGARLEGKAAIAAFYAGRKAQGPRTTVHIVNNFHLAEFTSDVALTRGIMSLVAGDGHPPLPSAVPLLITAAETRYIKIDRTWKVHARLNVPQFVDQASDLGERIAAAQHLGSTSPS